MRTYPGFLGAALLAGLALAGCAVPAAAPANYEPMAGDILFQSLPRGPLVDAIEGVTRSPWSHCGIIVRDGDKWAVLEAIGPVKVTPLTSWIRQARDDRFVAYRIRERSDDLVEQLIAAARTFLGRPYDIRYELDDEKIYCSELVQKAFAKVTGRELGQPRRLGDMNWRPFEAFIRQVEGGALPLDREIVSPQALTESSELTKVY